MIHVLSSRYQLTNGKWLSMSHQIQSHKTLTYLRQLEILNSTSRSLDGRSTETQDSFPMYTHAQ